MTIVNITGGTLEQALIEINKAIDGMRSYGVKTETLTNRSKVAKMVWSNGSATWSVGRPDTAVKCKCIEGEDLSKEAERVNVPYCKEEDHDQAWKEKGPAWEKIFKKTGYVEGQAKKTRPNVPCICTTVVNPVQCVDANEFIVTGLTRKVLQEMVPVLQQLPLYGGSFESRGRGEFNLSGIEIPPGLKKAWVESELGGVPLDIQSQIALDRKYEEN